MSFKRILLTILAGAALAACTPMGAITTAANTPVTAEQVASAKDVSYGLEASYDAALTVAIAWGRQPTCGAPKAPPVPACKTLTGLRSIEGVRAQLRSAIDRLNTVIADTKATSSALSVAVAAAKQAYAAYQDIAASNQMKGA